MPVPIYQVDAFAGRPFTGNPAGVSLLNRAAPTAWMQAVAEEMNLSETAFVTPGEAGPSLRWFTPAAEVVLCGHATLAAAHVLWEIGRFEAEAPIRFQTRWSGTLTCRRRGEVIEMDFPADPPEPVPEPAGLIEPLGIRREAITWIGRARHDYLVAASDPELVTSAEVDCRALARLETRGVILTAPGGDTDFVSRFFAPRLRVNEDPVTGSAHCVLGPFWQERLGRRRMTGEQRSARGGRVEVEPRGERIILGGRAVTWMAGAATDPEC